MALMFTKVKRKKLNLQYTHKGFVLNNNTHILLILYLPLFIGLRRLASEDLIIKHR